MGSTNQVFHENQLFLGSLTPDSLLSRMLAIFRGLTSGDHPQHPDRSGCWLQRYSEYPEYSEYSEYPEYSEYSEYSEYPEYSEYSEYPEYSEYSEYPEYSEYSE